MRHPAHTPAHQPFVDGTARFSRQTVGRRSVVGVTGEVDVHTAPSLRRAIDGGSRSSARPGRCAG